MKLTQMLRDKLKGKKGMRKGVCRWQPKQDRLAHVVVSSTPETLSTADGPTSSTLTRLASAARRVLHW